MKVSILKALRPKISPTNQFLHFSTSSHEHKLNISMFLINHTEITLENMNTHRPRSTPLLITTHNTHDHYWPSNSMEALSKVWPLKHKKDAAAVPATKPRPFLHTRSNRVVLYLASICRLALVTRILLGGLLGYYGKPRTARCSPDRRLHKTCCLNSS